MNKRMLLIALSIMLMVIGLCACGNDEKSESVIFMEDAVILETQNIVGENFVFSFNYVYSGNKPNVEVEEIEIDGLESYTFSHLDVSSDFELDDTYKDYKIGAHGVTVNYNLDNYNENPITIRSIVLHVNGERRKLDFKYPLQFAPVGVNTNSKELMPIQISNGCGIGAEVIFAYQAEENITFKGFSLGKYLELENLTVSIDYESNGEDELKGGQEIFPLELKKGETIVIRGNVTSEYYTGYQNVYATAIANYSMGGMEYSYHSSLYVEGVSDVNMVHNAIDVIINNQ